MVFFVKLAGTLLAALALRATIRGVADAGSSATAT